MNFTSIGFHTFNIFHTLTVYEGSALLNHAYECRDRTGAVTVRQLGLDDADSDTDDFTEKLKSKSRYFLIEYTAKHKGLSWLLRLTPKSPGFIIPDSNRGDVDRPCSIKARINPKLFTGIRDYLTAATADNLGDVETRFNLEAAKISPLMSRFADYEFSRIDYCINFALRELGLHFDPLLIIELFRRSNIPKHFYLHRNTAVLKDVKAAGIVSLPADDPDRNEFVLISDSININSYYKYSQLRDKFPDCPNIRDSIDVIRFEVQCLYPKVYYMAKALRGKDGFTGLFTAMLSDETSTGIIVNYFEKIIRLGDYYSMDEAIKKIQSYRFASKKENRLIAVLKDVDTREGIANAKVALGAPKAREDFRHGLRELAAIRINPVTIPEKYGIGHIPNLLDTYFQKVAEERDMKREAEAMDELLGRHGRKRYKKQRPG